MEKQTISSIKVIGYTEDGTEIDLNGVMSDMADEYLNQDIEEAENDGTIDRLYAEAKAKQAEEVVQ